MLFIIQYTVQILLSYLQIYVYYTQLCLGAGPIQFMVRFNALLSGCLWQWSGITACFLLDFFNNNLVILLPFFRIDRE